jgi:hypothetical protein
MQLHSSGYHHQQSLLNSEPIMVVVLKALQLCRRTTAADHTTMARCCVRVECKKHSQ